MAARLEMPSARLAGSGSHLKRVDSLAEAEAYWHQEGHPGIPPVHGLWQCQCGSSSEFWV